MGDRAVRCGGGGVAAARWWLAGGAAAKTPSPQAEALAMSCSVAIPSSPVFSPSRRPLSCKAASASPESVSVSSPAPSTAGSPLRPFRLLRAQIREEASPSPKTSSAAPSVATGSVLKRRRPALLMVPVDGAAAAAAAVAAVASVESDPSNEVEEEGEEFAAYCRRGRGRRRVEMEDRHVAKVALGGDPEVVSSIDATSPFSVMNLFAQFLWNTLDLPDHGFGGGTTTVASPAPEHYLLPVRATRRRRGRMLLVRVRAVAPEGIRPQRRGRREAVRQDCLDGGHAAQERVEPHLLIFGFIHSNLHNLCAVELPSPLDGTAPPNCARVASLLRCSQVLVAYGQQHTLPRGQQVWRCYTKLWMIKQKC